MYLPQDVEYRKVAVGPRDRWYFPLSSHVICGTSKYTLPSVETSGDTSIFYSLYVNLIPAIWLLRITPISRHHPLSHATAASDSGDVGDTPVSSGRRKVNLIGSAPAASLIDKSPVGTCSHGRHCPTSPDALVSLFMTSAELDKRTINTSARTRTIVPLEIYSSWCLRKPV